ncbi:unnamed protein product [Amaranthus hypochondriacus]
MAMWNKGPFCDPDDGEGVYSDEELRYGIRLLFCQYMHSESLTEILVSYDADNLNRLYYRCPVCMKRYWVKKEEINRFNVSLLNYDNPADVISHESSNDIIHDSDSSF